MRYCRTRGSSERAASGGGVVGNLSSPEPPKPPPLAAKKSRSARRAVSGPLFFLRRLVFFVGASGYVASTLYARARAYREFDRQSELALGDLGRHEAVAVRKKRSRRVPLDDEETSEEAVRSKSLIRSAAPEKIDAEVVVARSEPSAARLLSQRAERDSSR